MNPTDPPRQPPEVRLFPRPAWPRIWHDLMGGKDAHEPDRALNGLVRTAAPHAKNLGRYRLAIRSRLARYLAAEAGIRQFLVARLMTGLELLDPGVATAPYWRPELRDDPTGPVALWRAADRVAAPPRTAAREQPWANRA